MYSKTVASELPQGAEKSPQSSHLKLKPIFHPQKSIEQIMCKYYARLRQLPECPVTEELFFAGHSCPANRHCSFVPHTRAILTRISLPNPRFIASPLISPLPPWFNVDKNILTNFNMLKSSLSPSAITQMFHDLSQSVYASCIAAYTDGTRVEEPTYSTAAALVIPLRRGVSQLEAPLRGSNFRI
jgi:hypothetical protein